MNVYLKPTITLSAILGLIMGLMSVIPKINALPIFLHIFVGIALIIHLKKTNLVGQLSQLDGTIIGAISGFVSIITIFAFNLPVVAFFDKAFHLIISPSTHFMATNFNFLSISTVVIYLGLQSALFNAFGGFVTSGILLKKEEAKLDESDHIIIEN
ncbi:MAG: hypothetical protein PHV68_02770 [Candidatus Gastranaerophilales bacterium]|nr:hypothetical protein [Candidatus Gastranaerophilales bacterium]